MNTPTNKRKAPCSECEPVRKKAKSIMSLNGVTTTSLAQEYELAALTISTILQYMGILI